MAYMDASQGSGTGVQGLPEGHWMHKAVAKEKARIAKKKESAKAPAGGKALAGMTAAPAVPAAMPMAGGMKPC